eukprot:8696130-Prorocentrum_lima.AAC.1
MPLDFTLVGVFTTYEAGIGTEGHCTGAERRFHCNVKVYTLSTVLASFFAKLSNCGEKSSKRSG